MENAKHARTPAGSYKLSKADSPPIEEENAAEIKELYASMVGSLMYAAISTRPDIAHALSMVSRYSQNPGEQHVIALKRILRYLAGTPDKGLEYYGDTRKGLRVYADADWAGDIDDRKSTTGYVTVLYGCTVTWASKKQQTVSLSSTEAEYMALSASVQEIQWMHHLFFEMGIILSRPTKLYCDNQSAIQLGNNDINHSRSKHIPIRHHYIRDAIQAKEFELHWISTTDQIADIMTKSLGSILFERFKARIMSACEGSYNSD